MALFAERGNLVKFFLRLLDVGLVYLDLNPISINGYFCRVAIDSIIGYKLFF